MCLPAAHPADGVADWRKRRARAVRSTTEMAQPQATSKSPRHAGAASSLCRPASSGTQIGKRSADGAEHDRHAHSPLQVAQ